MGNKKVKWGIISTANIGTAKVIPGIQNASNCEVVAISSREIENAKSAAQKLNIPKAYGSYEELLADPKIDAVYNPLPNHLHVDWTIKAMEAGKHVLCEKPIGLNADNAQKLMDETQKYPKLKVMEAFMYRFHPQWTRIKELIDAGDIGEVKLVQSIFTYFNDDKSNIRNMSDIGGGGLMDIGCYNISFPRFLFGAEPSHVVGLMDYDPVFKTDRVASGIMDFKNGKRATFTCSTQLTPFQYCLILGTKGSIEIQSPIYTPSDESRKVYLSTDEGKKEIAFDDTDHYMHQAEAFAKAILNKTEVPTSLLDALNNMKVIDALVKSHKTKEWAMI